MPQPASPRAATVASGFVSGMLAGLPRRGLEPRALLAAVDISPALLGEPAARVPLSRYAALYNRVVAELGDEGFGLFSRPLRPGTLEFLCRSLLTAPELGTVLERAGRFLGLLLDDLGVGLEREGQQARLCIREVRPLTVGRVFAFEWLLRLLHGVSSWLVGRGIVLDAVDFPYPRPAHADDYVLIYAPRLRFGAPRLAAHFAAHYLELPVRRDEAALQRFLEGGPGRVTMLYRRDRELVLRVRDSLRAALPASATLQQVARGLYLSPRTLHRRLEEEGSSFRAVKDALRRDLATHRLARSDAPVGQIATELGFADPSAFYRAFVGWTGMAPRHYRRRIREGRP